MHVVRILDLLEEDFPHRKTLWEYDLVLRAGMGHGDNKLRVSAYECERISGVSVPIMDLFHRRMP